MSLLANESYNKVLTSRGTATYYISQSSSGITIYPEDQKVDDRIQWFLKGVKDAQLSNFEVLVNIEDNVAVVRNALKKYKLNYNIPLLVIGKRAPDDGVLIPNFSQLGGLTLGGHGSPIPPSSFNSVPWAEKVNKCKFVGLPTGNVNVYHFHLSEPYIDLPRIRLWHYGQFYPELLDITIVNPGIYKPKIGTVLPNIMHPVPVEDQLRFRGIIDVDGFAASERMFWSLKSNCVTLKMKSEFINWFYKWLVPNETHMEFSPNFSDLKVASETLVNLSESESHKITSAANKLAAHVFNRDTILKELRRAIEDYTEIYGG